MTSITLFGAAGTIGQRVLSEALSRGHSVRAVVRAPSKITLQSDNLTVVVGDVTDPESVATHALGADAVVSAVPPPRVEGADRESKSAALLEIAKGVIEGVRLTGQQPFAVFVGGAGTLEVSPGSRLVDAPSFPAVARWEALAHVDLLEYLGTVTDVEWTNLAPSARTTPGERTGVFRVGEGSLLVNAEGESAISMEDYAVALLDEIEKKQHVGQRFTVGY